MDARYPHALRGVLLTLIGGISWGFSGTCAQALMTVYGFDPLWISCYRMLSAGFVYVAILLAVDRKRFFAMITDRTSLGWIFLYAFAGIGFTQIAYLYAVGTAGAGIATLLQELGVALIMLVTCVRARRIPTRREALGLALAAVGVFVISTQGNFDSLHIPADGLFWGLLAACAMVTYTLIPVRLLAKWGSLQTMGISTLVLGIAMTLAYRPWRVEVKLSSEALFAFAAIVVVGTLLAYTLYLQGVKDAGPVLASLVGTVEPVSAMAFSAVWLGTPVTGFDAVGCVAILGMVFLITKESKGKTKDMGMQFRATRPEDITRVVEVLEDGRASLKALGIDQWQSGYPNRAAIEQDVKNGCSYVAECDGVIVGTIMAGFEGEPIYDDINGAWLTESTAAQPTYAVAHRVAVARDATGAGVASFLVAQVEELAATRGCKSVRIDTHHGNAPMRGMLQKNGYTECGVVLLDAALKEPTRERIGYEKTFA